MRRGLLLLDAWVARLLRWGLIGCVVGCLVLLAFGVAGRMVITLNLSGYHELIEILFAWGTYLGATLLWRERALLRVDFVLHLLPPALSWALNVLIELCMLTFAAMMLYYGWDFATGIFELTPFLQANKVYWYLSIPVCGSLMAAYSLAGLCDLLANPFVPSRASGRQQEIS
ncbi:MAG: TRAP transporter small permease [Alphaproteobacteria bacterium]|nr:TRAP transporter small permease [Alphaproteobacteria bacterium]